MRFIGFRGLVRFIVGLIGCRDRGVPTGTSCEVYPEPLDLTPASECLKTLNPKPETLNAEP